MLSLAFYEACTATEDRAQVEKFIEEYKEKGSALSLGSGADPLGNVMLESARQLSGGKQKAKKLKKPKKPKNLARGKGTTQRSKGRRRGGKVVRFLCKVQLKKFIIFQYSNFSKFSMEKLEYSNNGIFKFSNIPIFP